MWPSCFFRFIQVWTQTKPQHTASYSRDGHTVCVVSVFCTVTHAEGILLTGDREPLIGGMACALQTSSAVFTTWGSSDDLTLKAPESLLMQSSAFQHPSGTCSEPLIRTSWPSGPAGHMRKLRSGPQESFPYNGPHQCRHIRPPSAA